jgi:hypothetical protein
MMDQDRNLGVTEARFGLTLLIVLLGAIGFIVLMRLGGTSDQTVEIGPADEIVQDPIGDQTAPGKDEPLPLVLRSEPEELKPIALRPERPKANHPDGSQVPTAFPVLPAGSVDAESTDSQLR